MDAAACSAMVVSRELRYSGKKKWIRTALLDALDGGIGDGPVDSLSGILDSLGGGLLKARVGAEEASVADDGRAEHCGGVCMRFVSGEGVF